MVDGIVNHTGNAQHDDARRAYQQTGTGIIVAAESGDRLIARIDVHGFHHAQVIVERAKMKNFEKKPANGGMPANENNAKVMRNASLGLVR